MGKPIIHAMFSGARPNFATVEIWLFHDDGRPMWNKAHDAFVCYPCMLHLDAEQPSITLGLEEVLPPDLLSDPAVPLSGMGILVARGDLDNLTLRTESGEAHRGLFRTAVFRLYQRPQATGPDAPGRLQMGALIFVTELTHVDYVKAAQSTRDDAS